MLVSPPTVTLTRNGSVISGNDPSHPVVVSVGEQIQLTGAVANLPSGVTVIGHGWSVGGTRVSNYVQSLTAATVTSFSDPAMPGVTFYWTDSDNMTNYPVTYTAQLSNQTSVAATALFHVARPDSISFTGVTSTTTPVVNVGNLHVFDATTTSLNFGYNPGFNDGSPGIRFHMQLSTGYGGSFALVQLVNIVHSYVLTGSGVTGQKNSNGYVLDTTPSNTIPQYADSDGVFSTPPGTAEQWLDDVPAIGLTPYSSVVANQSFRTYFMYQPPIPNAIWVTLAVMNWNWAGTATQSGNSWSQATGTSFSANPPGVSSPVLPVWSSNIVSVRIQ